MVRPGFAVEYRPVLPIGVGIGGFEHTLILRGHHGGAAVGVVDGSEAARAAELYFLFVAVGVGYGLPAPPAFGLHFGADIAHETAMAFAAAHRADDGFAHVGQQSHVGHFGYGETAGVGFV